MSKPSVKHDHSARTQSKATFGNSWISTLNKAHSSDTSKSEMEVGDNEGAFRQYHLPQSSHLSDISESNLMDIILTCSEVARLGLGASNCGMAM